MIRLFLVLFFFVCDAFECLKSGTENSLPQRPWVYVLPNILLCTEVSDNLYLLPLSLYFFSYSIIEHLFGCITPLCVSIDWN